jgi:hypothetical protein
VCNFDEIVICIGQSVTLGKGNEVGHGGVLRREAHEVHEYFWLGILSRNSHMEELERDGIVIVRWSLVGRL